MPDYDYISQYRSGFAYVTKNNRAGLIDSNFIQIIPLEFDYIDCYDNGPFVFNDTIFAVKNDKTFLFNSKGIFLDSTINVIRPDPALGWLNQIKNISNLECYTNSDNWWSNYGCTQNDSLVIPFRYKSIFEGLSNENLLAFNGDSIHVYNLSGELIKKFPRANFTINRITRLYTFWNGKNIVIADKNFKTRRIVKVDQLTSTYGKYYSVLKDNKFGIIDDHNKTMIPFDFDQIHLFEFFGVCVKNNLAFILFNKSMSVSEYSFNNRWFEYYTDYKFMVIELESGYQIIDENGKLIAAQKKN